MEARTGGMALLPFTRVCRRAVSDGMDAFSFAVALITPSPWHITMPSGGGVHSIAYDESHPAAGMAWVKVDVQPGVPKRPRPTFGGASIAA